MLRTFAIILVGCMSCLALPAQEITVAPPRIITSGVRVTPLGTNGRFDVQGIRLEAPSDPRPDAAPGSHAAITTVELQLTQNVVRCSSPIGTNVRVEADKTTFDEATKTYTVHLYLANARLPITSTPCTGSVTLTIRAVAKAGEYTSTVASKSITCSYSN